MENAAVGELEPYMKAGFKLARRTKDPNAVKEMYKHFEEAVREQYGTRKPANAAKKIPVPAALLSKELGIEQIEMIDDDSSNSSTSSVSMTTTSKSIVEVCSSPPPTITLEQAKLDPVINIDSDSDMETDNIESYSCCKCKEGNLGKNLVECQECHSMYHQNCHVPPITDINLNDPRIVWYCGSCRQKTESRSLTKESKKSSKSISGIKAEKLSSSKSSQNSKSVSGKSKSSSANSSPKHPFTATSSSAMSAAEKRVQMMKKKATKKTDKKK